MGALHRLPVPLESEVDTLCALAPADAEQTERVLTLRPDRGGPPEPCKVLLGETPVAQHRSPTSLVLDAKRVQGLLDRLLMGIALIDIVLRLNPVRVFLTEDRLVDDALVEAVGDARLLRDTQELRYHPHPGRQGSDGNHRTPLVECRRGSCSEKNGNTNSPIVESGVLGP